MFRKQRRVQQDVPLAHDPLGEVADDLVSAACGRPHQVAAFGRGCVQQELEFLAGQPSPAEDRDLRMKYQVDRLAESMSGARIRQPATEEAREAEKTWLGLYALPAADYDAFGQRAVARRHARHADRSAH